MISTSVAPRLASSIETWHDEADVVVVGFGAAGASAAYEAIQTGAEVLVLERAGAGGGASAMSDGLIYLGGGTATQREAGLDDSVEEMKKFLLAATGPGPDPEKIEVYCDNSLEHYDWLLARGVRFIPNIKPDGNGARPHDDEGLMFTGGENAWPFDEVAKPAQRAHHTKNDGGGGAGLMAALSRAALEAGARTSYDTRVDRLVVDDNGAVVGVIAARFGEEVAIKARSGVVLTAGGFVFNSKMLAQYAPVMLETKIRLGTDGDDGRGIRVAQAVGAAVKHMDATECGFPFNAPRNLVKGILVNGRGQRFINEDTYMGRVGQKALIEEHGEVYLVINEENYTPNWLTQTAAWVSGSAAELEAEIGLPSGSLAGTVDYYNEHARDGDDPLFHKRPPHLVPLDGPLAAFDLRNGPFFYAVFSLGGLHTLASGEVLDLDGEPIPGLFAAGRTTSGIAAHGYASGLSLGDSTMFGRFAGRSAAGAKLKENE